MDAYHILRNGRLRRIGGCAAVARLALHVVAEAAEAAHRIAGAHSHLHAARVVLGACAREERNSKRRLKWEFRKNAPKQRHEAVLQCDQAAQIDS